MSYRERLSVPASWWCVAVVALVTLWVVVAAPLDIVIASVVTLIAAVLLIGGLIRYGAAVVAVDADRLTAGRASIERTWLGEVEPLTGEAARNARGRDCDARAYLLLRPYLRDAVRVHLTDPDDPAPYWLIGTRHPQQLANALKTQQTGPKAGLTEG